MIKRLDLSAVTGRSPRWPAGHDGRTDSLFSARKPLRKVVVLIDHDVLTDDGRSGGSDLEQVDDRSVLSDLLDNALISVLRYADEGPPSTAKRTRLEPFGGDVYEGWAVLEGDRDPSDGVWTAIFPTDEGFSMSAVVGNAPEVAFKGSGSSAYGDLSAPAASERRKADELAAQVAAQGVRADIFVTERPYLLEASRPRRRGVTICRPGEAVSLLALYLRAQGEFQVAPGFTFNRGLYFWVGTRELLPEAWRWFTACVQSSDRSRDEGLMILGASLVQRVCRALVARDAIQARSS
jgi:hypothetical protein